MDSFKEPGRSFRAGEFARGTALAAISLALAFALARFGFGNDYYFAILTPIAMIGCLLAAWGLYLKDDGFIKKHAVPGEPSVPGAGEPASTSDMRAPDNAGPGDKIFTKTGTGTPDAAMFAPRDNTLVPRAVSGPARQGSTPPEPSATGRPARGILLWAAAWLALAACLLYALAGVGAKYFV